MRKKKRSSTKIVVHELIRGKARNRIQGFEILVIYHIIANYTNFTTIDTHMCHDHHVAHSVFSNKSLIIITIGRKPWILNYIYMRTIIQQIYIHIHTYTHIYMYIHIFYYNKYVRLRKSMFRVQCCLVWS